MSSLSSFTGCMIGGALGDVLGYPVEFMSYNQIIEEHGINGVEEPLLEEKDIAKISEETQMTLFTAEGLIWADKVKKKVGYSSIPARCFCSYQRWLHAQGYPLAEPAYDWMLQDERLEIESPLLRAKELFHHRKKKMTCIEALLEARNQEYGTIEQPINRSKSADVVIRVAPIGLALYTNPKRAFEVACDVAAITHTHPNAYYSAGIFSAMIACLLQGKTMFKAAEEALGILEYCPSSEQTRSAIENAMKWKVEKRPVKEAISRLGKGFVAEEALAIGLYCALCEEENYKQAVCMAVNHDGDSDMTAAICGSLIGAKLGITGLVPEWVKHLEGKNVILEMANLLYTSYA